MPPTSPETENSFRDRLDDRHLLTPDALAAMRRYRLGRFRDEMAAHDVGVAILSNPLSTRYVADIWQFPVFQARVPVHYLAVPVEGPVINFGGLLEIETGGDAIVSESRPGRDNSVFQGGFDLEREARGLATDIAAFAAECGVDGGRVAIENMSPFVALAFRDAGIDVIDGQYLVDRAHLIKCEEEIECMRRSIAVAELGMTRMAEMLRPGIRESEMWGEFNRVCIANGAEWFDGHQLVSGPRTNPPGQEATDREIRDGELVAYDTDMIGPLGYCADLSRTYHCGPSKPTVEQHDLFARAVDQLLHDRELFRPGASYREISERGYRVGEGYVKFACIAHGLGMADEYPFIRVDGHPEGFAYEGEILEGMVMCVEAYAGKIGGAQGVKLEDQIAIRKDGPEVLNTYPLEASLLG